MRGRTERLRHAAPLCFFIWFAACGHPDQDPDRAPSASAFTVEDSAGITVAVTDGDRAFGLPGWSISSSPDLLLGDQSEADDQFYRIRGVVPQPNRGIAVLDGSSRELRFYDVDGNLIRRTGREGSGPNEFREPRIVPTLAADSLLIYDSRLRRFTAYSAYGEQPGQISRFEPSGAPLGVLGGGVLVDRRPVIRVEDLQRAGVDTLQPTYLWLDVASGTEVILGSYVIARLFTYPPGPGEALPSGRSIPFTAMPSATVSRQGAVLTSGSAYEILEFDATGALKRVLRVDSSRRPVTREDVNGVIDLELSQLTSAPSRSEYARTFREMPFPDSMPGFVSLHVDELGWLCAQLYDWDSTLPTRWVVFDPDGHGRGTVDLPAGLRIHHIGADFVLGVLINDYGVEYVQRHPLERAS